VWVGVCINKNVKAGQRKGKAPERVGAFVRQTEHLVRYSGFWADPIDPIDSIFFDGGVLVWVGTNKWALTTKP
jgi:hypothetical protein